MDLPRCRKVRYEGTDGKRSHFPLRVLQETPTLYLNGVKNTRAVLHPQKSNPAKTSRNFNPFFIVSIEILYHYPKTQAFRRFSYPLEPSRTFVRPAKT
jgi:hypothetical protein